MLSFSLLPCILLIIFEVGCCIAYTLVRDLKGFPRPVVALLCCGIPLAAALYAMGAAAAHPALPAWLICWALLMLSAADYTVFYLRGAGMALYALGHVCDIAALLLLASPCTASWITLAAGVMLLALLYLCILRFSPASSPLRRPALFIALALLSVPLCAFSIGTSPLLLAGSICFAISDVLLCMKLCLETRSRLLAGSCLLLYAAAQILFALSLAI